jgi:riboflavin biosynthesis pyrimidine reductase
VRGVDTPRQPLKVVVDRHGELPKARPLADGEVIVVTASTPRDVWPATVRTMTCPIATADRPGGDDDGACRRGASTSSMSKQAPG